MTAAAAPAAWPLTDSSYAAAREKAVMDFELAYVTELLERAEHNLSLAARLAGVDRTTIYRLMDRHNIRRVYAAPETDAGIAASER